MPEALAIVLVFFVSTGVLIYARTQANDPAWQNPAEDLPRLQMRAESLQRRLRLAQKENWGHDMVASIVTELEATSIQLAEAKAPSVR